MSDTNVGGTTETPDVIDWEARAKKAEAKIVSDRKANEDQTIPETIPEVKEVQTNTFMTRDDYQAEEFFKNNADLSEHKDYIMEKVSKGNSFDEAKALAKLKDPTIENRKKAKQANFTAWETPVELKSFSMETLEDKNLSQADYNRIMDMVDSGKAKLTA